MRAFLGACALAMVVWRRDEKGDGFGFSLMAGTAGGLFLGFASGAGAGVGGRGEGGGGGTVCGRELRRWAPLAFFFFLFFSSSWGPSPPALLGPEVLV